MVTGVASSQDHILWYCDTPGTDFAVLLGDCDAIVSPLLGGRDVIVSSLVRGCVDITVSSPPAGGNRNVSSLLGGGDANVSPPLGGGDATVSPPLGGDDVNVSPPLGGGASVFSSFAVNSTAVDSSSLGENGGTIFRGGDEDAVTIGSDASFTLCVVVVTKMESTRGSFTPEESECSELSITLSSNDICSTTLCGETKSTVTRNVR